MKCLLFFGGIIMKNELEENKVNMKRPMKLYLFIDSLKNRVSIQLLFHESDEQSWKHHTIGTWKIPEHNGPLTEICKLVNFSHSAWKLAKHVGLNKEERKIIKGLAIRIEESLLEIPATKLPIVFFKSASKQFYPSAKRAKSLLSIHKDVVYNINELD